MPISLDAHTSAIRPPASAEPARGSGMKFADLLDMINPLQHIPVVSQIYRHLTGDSIRAPFRLAGGALFGGPLGAAFAAGGMLFDAARGATTDAPGQAAAASEPASPAFEARGGWMVAATRGAPVAPAVPADAPATAPAERRGGWMAAAAYAHTDRMAAHPGAFSERA